MRTVDMCHAEFTKAYGDNYEIICVNDGSADNTVEVLKQLQWEDNRVKVVHYSRNRGKGYAVRQGLKVAQGQAIGYLDSDGDIHPRHMVEYEQQLGTDTDIIVGSKTIEGGNNKKSLIRHIVSYGFMLVNKSILGLSVRDTQVGCKVMKRMMAQDAVRLMTVDGFAFDAELLYLAEKMGYNAKEAPVQITESGGSSLSFRAALRMVQSLLAIRKTHNAGGFGVLAQQEG